MVIVGVMEELKAPIFVKLVCPVRMYCANEEQTHKKKHKCNTGNTEDSKLKVKDLKHKLVVDEYLEGYKTYKEGTKS